MSELDKLYKESLVHLERVRKSSAKKWYHVSPSELQPGTGLTPFGGTSPYGRTQGTDPEENHLWVTDTLPNARDWQKAISSDTGVEPKYVYEVTPNETPAARAGGTSKVDSEWGTSGATIKRLVPDQEVEDSLLGLTSQDKRTLKKWGPGAFKDPHSKQLYNPNWRDDPYYSAQPRSSYQPLEIERLHNIPPPENDPFEQYRRPGARLDNDW